MMMRHLRAAEKHFQDDWPPSANKTAIMKIYICVYVMCMKPSGTKCGGAKSRSHFLETSVRFASSSSSPSSRSGLALNVE